MLAEQNDLLDVYLQAGFMVGLRNTAEGGDLSLIIGAYYQQLACVITASICRWERREHHENGRFQ